ncbi:MarR family winged helix-turn-helix transcriptional regulator [Corynebacterium lubricantis]|uniref:MarR family winged helix-turn-helix transcriptional regulator n=1 Tax=Corynebacterium lubricantis TaxID=541095 RepID=UPI00036F68E6|nr:MarR family winged helix-turn-helix transcriptional regulator [Corynebacterium lubricantis]
MDKAQEPRWLNEEERGAWNALASMMILLPGALDTQLKRDADISHFEYRVMSTLSEVPGRSLRMSDLATLADSALPRLSQVVAKLEKRGWIQREPDPTDGRYTTATLTEAGWEKVVDTAPGHAEEVRRLVIDPLTKTQLRALTEIGKRVVHEINPANPPTH